MKLVFPLPLNLANSRLHWAKKHRLKDEYWIQCDLAIFTANGKRIPRSRDNLTKASISSVMYLPSMMDDDNAMNRHKWILDWLKDRGFIADDAKKVLKWAGFPEQRIDRKNPRIEITLEAA